MISSSVKMMTIGGLMGGFGRKGLVIISSLSIACVRCWPSKKKTWKSIMNTMVFGVLQEIVVQPRGSKECLHCGG